ncbi:hypothetical protein TSUD_393270 [Trifolium subterraneum]|uniref:Retrotransposon gag domain-containing protein n=1 Tax=Trifolium subterraneum TaxID=3900 RepID=A0A2Z6NCQ0_TRISU|nr:hypothetical protein TSUD_393270 [Trifolium subterraneum]
MTSARANAQITESLATLTHLLAKGDDPARDGEKRLDRFLKHKSSFFVGGFNPDGAVKWVEEVEIIFDAMECANENKLALGTYVLREEANQWWKNAKLRLGDRGVVITWEMFKREFFNKYFLADVKNKKVVEFMKLEQGNMSVVEYAAKFESLCAFSPHYNTPEAENDKCVKLAYHDHPVHLKHERGGGGKTAKSRGFYYPPIGISKSRKQGTKSGNAGGLRPGAKLLRPGANLHSRFCFCLILPAPWRESAAPRREALQNQFKTEKWKGIGVREDATTWSEAIQSSEAQSRSERLKLFRNSEEFRSSRMFRGLQEFRGCLLVMSHSEDEVVQKLNCEGLSEANHSKTNQTPSHQSLNEDLSNNQNPSTSGANQTSIIDSTATTLCLICDDNESIQWATVNGLLDQYEEFRMEVNESIEEMNIRFQAITSKLEEHNNKLSNKELVSKLLRSLPLDWNEIPHTIVETEDINSMSPESLIDLLRAHELALKDMQELKVEEAEAARKGNQALEHEDLVEEPDEEYLERAPGAEGSSSEDGSDSEDSSSDEKSEPESKESIQRTINQLKADYENLSKQANLSEGLEQKDFIKTKDLEKDFAICYKPLEHSLILKEYCNINADQNKFVSMLCNLKTNNTNGIGYSSSKTLEEPSSSVIDGSFSLPNLYTTFVSDSTQMKQMKDEDFATNSLGPSIKWVPRDKIVYLIAGETKTLNLPITWMHVTVNGRRIIVHKRHILEESDGEEDEEEYIRSRREHEELEACFEYDNNSVWWSDCSGYDSDYT